MKRILLFLVPILAHSAEVELAPIEVNARALKEDTSVIIDRETIEAANTSDVGNLLRQAAGLDYRSNVSGLTGFSIRGSNPEHVLVLIDGVRVNDPSGPNRAYDFSRLNPADIESIEIIKGSASVAYGSDALGGVVLIRTKGRTGAPLTVQIQGGSYHTGRASLSAARPTTKNLTLFTETAYQRATGPSQAKAPESDRASNLDFTAGAKWDSDDSKTFFESSVAYNRNDQFLDDDSFVDDPDYRGISEQWNLRGRGRHAWSDSHTTSALVSYLDTKRDYRDATSPTDFFDNTELNRGKNYQTEVIHEAKLANFGNASEAQLGAEWNLEQYALDTPTAANRLSRQSQYQLAPFAQLGFGISPELRLIGGARAIAFGPEDKAITERAAVQYSLGKGRMLELKVATGFKTPSLYQLHSPSFGNAALKSERSTAYSLGYESARFSASVFQTNYRELIGFDPATFRSINTGRARVRGFESEFRIPITASWTLAPHYTYLSARDESKNRELPGRARHKGGGRLRFQSDRIVSGLEWIAKSSRFDDSRFPRNAGFGVWHATAEYFFDSLRTFSVNVRVDNILDRDYMEKVGYTSPGRSAYVGLGYSGL